MMHPCLRWNWNRQTHLHDDVLQSLLIAVSFQLSDVSDQTLVLFLEPLDKGILFGKPFPDIVAGFGSVLGRHGPRPPQPHCRVNEAAVITLLGEEGVVVEKGDESGQRPAEAPVALVPEPEPSPKV